MPAQNCCRIYSRENFSIKAHFEGSDWLDLCVNDMKKAKTTIDLTEIWGEKTSSFKCSSHMAIHFCNDKSTCSKKDQAESAASGA